MHSLLWLGCRAFLISLVLTPICRDVFRSYGVVDEPDHARKIHRYAIPRVGGLAIGISYLAAYLLVRPEEGSPLAQQLSLVWKLLPGGVLVLALGLLDDLFNLRAWHKLLGQLAAAGLACWGGVRIMYIAHTFTDSWWTVPLTIVWLLACMNAFNLVDGLDGLAAGVGLFATLTVFIAAIMQHSAVLAVATLASGRSPARFPVLQLQPGDDFSGRFRRLADWLSAGLLRGDLGK